MATPNYGFEKRQKELAKKRKKEEKLKNKAVRKQGPNGEDLNDGQAEPEAGGSDDAAGTADVGGNPTPS